MQNQIALVVGIGAALLVGAYLMVNQASLDLAGPLRDRLWQRDARRMRSRNRYPVSLRRSYWTEREHQRDVARLEPLGYVVASQVVNDPYVTAPEDPRSRRPPARRRVPMYHVIYERRDPAAPGIPTP